MHRRTFLQTLTALIAAPALPATPASGTTLTRHLGRATMLARCHDRASPEMFGRLMQLDTDTAQGVFDLLRKRGVIARGTDGLARAVNPLNTHCIPNEALRARDLAQITSDLTQNLRKRLEKRVKDAVEPDPPQPGLPNEPETSDTATQ